MTGTNDDGTIFNYDERRYCCDTADENRRWGDCTWEDSVGFMIVPRDSGSSGVCMSGCPSDKVRVAMDDLEGGCRFKLGARARCCRPRFVTMREDPPVASPPQRRGGNG